MPQTMDNLHFLPRPLDKHPTPGTNNDSIIVKHSDGGGGGGMDGRVARLEADVEHIKTDIADLKENLRAVSKDVSDMKSDVSVIKSNYVSKWFLLTALISVVTVGTSLVQFIAWCLQKH